LPDYRTRPLHRPAYSIDLDQFPGRRFCRWWSINTIAPDRLLTTRPHAPLRHCPICGIAMQAKKSRDDSPQFDLFECLSCETTIRHAKPAAKGERDS
jgi:hypothetical protein